MQGLLTNPGTSLGISIGNMELAIDYLSNVDEYEPELTEVKTTISKKTAKRKAKKSVVKPKLSKEGILNKYSLVHNTIEISDDTLDNGSIIQESDDFDFNFDTDTVEQKSTKTVGSEENISNNEVEHEEEKDMDILSDDFSLDDYDNTENYEEDDLEDSDNTDDFEIAGLDDLESEEDNDSEDESNSFDLDIDDMLEDESESEEDNESFDLDIDGMLEDEGDEEDEGTLDVDIDLSTLDKEEEEEPEIEEQELEIDIDSLIGDDEDIEAEQETQQETVVKQPEIKKIETQKINEQPERKIEEPVNNLDNTNAELLRQLEEKRKQNELLRQLAEEDAKHAKLLEQAKKETTKVETPKTEVKKENVAGSKPIKPVEVTASKYDKYTVMTIDALYNCVKQFMQSHGVKTKLIDVKVLNEEFGANNIQNLIVKQYLIKTNKGVTVGK